MKKVLILGGYGNFGSRIALGLAKANIPIIIAGRNQSKAVRLQKELMLKYSQQSIETSLLDASKKIEKKLIKLKPFMIINTAGPFQTSDYSVAKACIKLKIHYIDLADGRSFVKGINSLNKQALKNKVLIVSGASTVPALSSAVLAYYKNDFSEIDSLIYGISLGQKTSLGLATAKSILTYLGKPLKSYEGSGHTNYGWQDLYRQDYPELGKRWMANCDIPDFDIFPKKYGIKSMKFSAGIESSFIHIGMWLLSYLIRLGLPFNLSKHAESFFNFSVLFKRFGTKDGGMHFLLEGKDLAGKPKVVQWFIIAKKGDGPQIPCAPAIILAKKLISGQIALNGATPCVELITLKEYLDELKGLAIKQVTVNKYIK